MQERQLKIGIVLIALSGILIHFQNCGSSPGQQAGSDMKIINPVETGSIQFLQSKTEISNATTQLVALGVCSAEQDGAVLSWRLADEQFQQISSGQSLCDRGAFEVIYEEASMLECNATIRLTAFLGSQEKTELLVEKKCL
jgi:hypothetical protein